MTDPNLRTRAVTLLIVDDSRVSRMMIKGRVQTAHPDWVIYEASDGPEALALVQSQAPDFISMDVNMPGITGFEAIEQIRAAGSKARIVMMTANVQLSSRERAAELGVYFVKKPAAAESVQLMLAHFNQAS